MSLDLHSQLSLLRRKVARIDRKYAAPPPAAGFLTGAEVHTARGVHWEMEVAYPEHAGAPTAPLAELAPDLLASLSQGAIPHCRPERWAFLDTETSGLAGGSGTLAFLIGVGRITPAGFTVRQYFLREQGEEASALLALTGHLAEFDVLITYNGKAFDQPLLETRFRMQRAKPPFARLEHLDLLFGARRLWKLQLESCRLVELEKQILGFTRVGDVAGDLIPLLYFQYLRTRKPGPLEPVLEHNRLDIVSLACLTAVVCRAFQDPAELTRASGFELIGLGRWLIATGRAAEGLALLKRGIERHIPDALLFKTLWEIAVTEKKLGLGPAGFADLAQSRNPYRVQALEELAKHYEHKEKNPALALEFAEAALALEASDQLEKRRTRLRKRLAAPRARLLEAP